MSVSPIRKTLFIACAAALSFGAGLASAQQAPTGARVMASEPGKAAVADTIEMSVAVTAIDKKSRKITMKGPQGEVFDLVAGDEVKNFDQIKVGNLVVVRYVRALSLELKKNGGALSTTEKTDAVTAKPGGQPGAAAGRQVKVMTKVVDVNPQARTISLEGPKGRVLVLDVKNPDHFKVVKKGDRVEAVYTEAVAISVEPAAKK